MSMTMTIHRQWEALPLTNMAFTTWAAMSGNGAKTNTRPPNRRVCCAGRRGVLATRAFCFLRLASVSSLRLSAISLAFELLSRVRRRHLRWLGFILCAFTPLSCRR